MRLEAFFCDPFHMLLFVHNIFALKTNWNVLCLKSKAYTSYSREDKKIVKWQKVWRHKNSRVTSLEQLSLAEFSGEYARSKVYENDHKNVLGI